MKKGVLVHPDEFDEVWIGLAKKHSCNYLSMHPIGGKRAPMSMKALLEQVVTPEFTRMRELAEKEGLTVEYEMHAARYLLPAEEFGTHPDWFRMNKAGERTPDYNFCASNREALAYASERAVQAAKTLKPSSHRYFFWLDDAKDSCCHCEKCRGYSAADQQLILLNAFERALRAYDPQAKLSYLAYFDAAQVPQKVRPEEGVFLEFAPFERERYFGIGDPACVKNAAQVKDLPGLLEFFGKKDSKVLDYWLDNSMYSNWTKPPREFAPANDVITADAAYYRKLGFEEISTFACYLGPDYRALYGPADLGTY